MILGPMLFPRVEAKDAHRLRSSLITRMETQVEFSEADFDSALNSSRAFPPTGGTRIGESDLRELRRTCLEAVDNATSDQGVVSSSNFDLAVGKILFETGEESVGEFGDPFVWDFITLILLPDLAAKRLAMRSTSRGKSISMAERITGGSRRHVFQRLWKRWLIFGCEIVESGKLTEDDYGATIERLITNRPALAREVAEAIIRSGYSGDERREYTRVFMRKLQQTSGLVQIRDDDEVHLRKVIEEVHRQTAESVGDAAESDG